jgi:hypothetical protein
MARFTLASAAALLVILAAATAAAAAAAADADGQNAEKPNCQTCELISNGIEIELGKLEEPSLEGLSEAELGQRYAHRAGISTAHTRRRRGEGRHFSMSSLPPRPPFISFVFSPPTLKKRVGTTTSGHPFLSPHCRNRMQTLHTHQLRPSHQQINARTHVTHSRNDSLRAGRRAAASFCMAAARLRSPRRWRTFARR